MPRLTIPSILSQCETWVASNPCPKNEDGESRHHARVARGAFPGTGHTIAGAVSPGLVSRARIYLDRNHQERSQRRDLDERCRHAFARSSSWLDKWSHLPNFGYYVLARSVGLRKYETQEFFSAALKGEVSTYLQRREAEKAEITNAADLLEFDRDDDEASLIGDRWMCKGRQAVLQGPTGVGKSSLELQWAMRLFAGLPFFGIKAANAMRVLIIQAENDIGDMAEAFQDTLDALSAADLKSHHVDLIHENLTIVNNDTATGEQFRDFLGRKIAQFKPDIVLG
jgi:AAA domain